MDPKPYKPLVHDLASRIYADLVVRAVTAAGSSGKMATSPENLAKLSFDLAEAFQAVEDVLNSANLPKNVGFNVGTSDIAEWSKPHA
jgi:geranylgeranyl pyrophosphate synthase